MPHEEITIAVLAGDGVGPEVTREAVLAIDAACGTEAAVRFEAYPVGGSAIDLVGSPLPDQTLEGCRAADAILLGAVGGPRWHDVAPDRTPEAGLLKLRRSLGLYANLRPVRVYDSIADASPVKPELVRGVDILVVRELTGGIYFGPSRKFVRDGIPAAESAMVYDSMEIERIASVAFESARRRRRKVVSVDKANVLEVSRLWRDIVGEIHDRQYRDISLSHCYVDSAAMQLVARPTEFDVVLAPNLFGDILSDLIAVLPGSLGLLPSASIGGQVGLFEPVHGSAPDLAGTGRANPIGAILSGALLLNHLGLAAEAGAIERAVETVLDDGYRTADLGGDGDAYRKISTEEMGERIATRAAEMINRPDSVATEVTEAPPQP